MLASTLDEGRRRAYLAALGIPLFQARQALPGAATRVIESEPMDLMVGVPASEPSRPTVPPEPSEPSVPPLRQMPTLPPIVAHEPPVESRAPLLQTVTLTAPTPRFACRLMPLGEHGFVLLDLGSFPDVVAGEVLNLPAPEQQLWRNLQRALSWHPGEPEPDFIWPRAVKGLLGDDADTARDMLSAWLKRQIPAPARLWVFGESLAPFVTRPHRLLPGLADMLASPLAKRQVWQQLSQAVSES